MTLDIGLCLCGCREMVRVRCFVEFLGMFGCWEMGLGTCLHGGRGFERVFGEFCFWFLSFMFYRMGKMMSVSMIWIYFITLRCWMSWGCQAMVCLVAMKWVGEVGFIGGGCFESVLGVFGSSEMAMETCLLAQ